MKIEVVNYIYDTYKEMLIGFYSKLFLKREYISANKIEYPGLSVEKLIGMELIALPEEYSDNVSNWTETNNVLSKTVNCGFNYPLAKLFNSEKNVFELNEDFEGGQQKLQQISRPTKNKTRSSMWLNGSVRWSMT